ncbi:MAG: hypothetical protein N2512_02445 [Armatimonadetes bacterium]|nr:hypothetical protein [Armatimonadota bacterium]
MRLTRRELLGGFIGAVGAWAGGFAGPGRVNRRDARAQVDDPLEGTTSPRRNIMTAQAGQAQQAEVREATAMKEPIDIGGRLELLGDGALIDRMSGGAELRLNQPVSREVCMVFDEPWEGGYSGAYMSVFQDEGMYRMYYRGMQCDIAGGQITQIGPPVVCYAESDDGITWRKPRLGIVEFQGSRENNIVWAGPGAGEFAVFKDDNPAAPADGRYKMIVAEDMRTLKALKSADGLHWTPLSAEPIVQDPARMSFDSQNLAFWDSVQGQYRAYFRVFRRGVRDIDTATSEDFVHWSEREPLDYMGAPDVELYTNVVKPYYRAPHIYVGLPTRYVERRWSPTIEALPNLEHRRMRATLSEERSGTAVTETLLMISRDGRVFRRWEEAFVRPGPETPDTWKYGDCYAGWHVVETASHIAGAARELSLYLSEGYWMEPASWLRRYTLRLDGFVSVWAPMSGGEIVTKPLVFQGARLAINFSSSAAGNIYVEVQNAAGQPVEGFSLDDCYEIVGDSVERVVLWKGGTDLSRLAGQPIRLRFVMRDADLYSLRFLP